MAVRLLDVVRFIGRSSKRVAVTVVGFTLVLGGVVLLPAPGPGALVIIAGLAVLGTEYTWARRALNKAKERADKARERVRRRRQSGRHADAA